MPVYRATSMRRRCSRLDRESDVHEQQGLQRDKACKQDVMESTNGTVPLVHLSAERGMHEQY